MATWSFKVTDATNHRFEVSNGSQRLRGSGSNSSGAPEITGGLASTTPDNRLRARADRRVSVVPAFGPFDELDGQEECDGEGDLAEALGLEAVGVAP